MHINPFDINPGDKHQHLRFVELTELIFIILLKKAFAMTIYVARTVETDSQQSCFHIGLDLQKD